MRIKVVSKGETEFDADGVYQEQPIGIAIASGDEAHIRSEIIDCTDTERSDIDHDEHATVTEDDGTVLWEGWLGGVDGPAPADADDLRALVVEMCAYFERFSTREDDEYIAECRQRAGLEDGS